MKAIFKISATLLVFIILLNGQILFAQNEELSLEQCQKEVQAKFPLVKGRDLLKKSLQLDVENLKVAYLPRLYANGKVSYQSDVTGINLPGVLTPNAPKDQYSLNLDVNQLIYDGGKTKSRIKLDEKNTEVELRNIDIQMYQLREQVNQSFFSIQLVRKSKLVLQEKQKTVSEKVKQVKSAVENGLVLDANLKVLQAELLLIDQQFEELSSIELTSFSSLSELMGKTLTVDTKLLSTELSKDNHDSISAQRPEYLLYSSQKSLLDAQDELVRKDRLPVVTGFGQLGYGNPGYNQLMDEFDTYFMLGAKVSWNVFDWKSNRRKQKTIGIKRELINTKELSFKQNQLINLGKETNNIKKLKTMILKDDAIIELQESISNSSASQLDNGVITSSDYLEDLNKEIQAKLNKEYHLIQLQQAFAEYNRIKGN